MPNTVPEKALPTSAQHPAIMACAAPDAKDRRDPAERRTCTRLAVNSLIFVKVGDFNGGIAFNISEGGLALSTANRLPDGKLPALSIQLPESVDWIQVEGQIAWRGKSNKEAGVEFVGLPQDARQRLKDWICSWNAAPAPDDLTTFKKAPPEGGLFHPLVSLDLADNVSERTVQGASSTLVNPYCPETVLDRRVYLRKQIIPLAYVQLGEGNGGIALNVSEGGLAITAAMILVDDHLPSVRLQFPDAGHWVDVKGEIAWKSESKREAGIRFVGLTEEARLQLRNWISSPTPTSSTPRQPDRVAATEENHELPLGLLKAPERLQQIEARSALGNATEDVGSPSDSVTATARKVADPELADPSAKTLLLKGSIKRHLRLEPKLDRCVKSAGPHHRARRALMALMALSGLVLLTKEWVIHQSKGARLIEAVTLRKRVLTGEPKVVVQSPFPKPLNAPQIHVDTMEGQATKKVPPEESAGVPSTPQSNPQERVETEEGSSAVTAFKNHIGSVQNSPAPYRSTSRLSLTPAPVRKGTVESNGPYVASAPAPPWPQQEPRIAMPLTSLVSPPKTAPSSGFENAEENKNGRGEGPSALPKRAVGTAGVNGTVVSLTAPYLSIRLPHGPNGKRKSRGGTSLQLGRLISRVEPVYPEEAKQKGIEGTVKIHVIVSREGTVQQVVNIDGPPLLVPVTWNAVRQWRYTETLLAGQAVETEDDIAVTFRLSGGGEVNK